MGFTEGWVVGAVCSLAAYALCLHFDRWLDREPAKPPRVPVAGEVWPHKAGGPWPSSRTAAKILDAKDGWVRYSMLAHGRAGGCFQDERMELSSFLWCYMPPEST